MRDLIAPDFFAASAGGAPLWIRASFVLRGTGASTLPLEPIGEPIVILNPFL